MEWNEMSPRERDALVATEVMGWTEAKIRVKRRHGTELDDGYIESWEEDGIKKGYRTHVFDPDIQDSDLPSFTTDISAAWEVVEKMRAEGWAYMVADHEDKVRAYASFRDRSKWHNEDGAWGSANAKTAPEAICLAALRAKAIDV